MESHLFYNNSIGSDAFYTALIGWLLTPFIVILSLYLLIVFYPEDRGSKFLRNLHTYISKYMAGPTQK
jgi:hypothetical protein